MVKIVAHFFVSVFRPILLFVLVFFSYPVSAETIREFHERMCNEGKQDSCERAREIKEGEMHGAWVDELGQRFSETVNREELEEDNKPILNKAYPIVLDNYFSAERQKNGKQHYLDQYRMKYCADHYHNYWRYRKMIWPVNEDNTPDWATIYFFIVEHYYGYCLRQPL